MEDKKDLEEFSFSVNSSRLDFQTLVEADEPPPIAFKNRAALDAWVDSHSELKVEKIGRRAIEDVISISGRVGTQRGLYSYSQVWVHVGYEHYRNAIKFELNSKESAVQEKALKFPDDDADHAVGRSRLKELWPDAWVNLLFVESEVNRAFGAAFEKSPLIIPEGCGEITQINLDLVCLCKTFLNGRLEGFRRESIGEYFLELRDCFVRYKHGDDFMGLMEDYSADSALYGIAADFDSERVWPSFKKRS